MSVEPLADLGLAFGLAGVLNAYLMAAILARQHRAGMSRAGGALALLIFFIGSVFAIVIAEHAGWIPFHWALQALEMALALAIAPLVLFYVSRALNINPPGLWSYTPLGAFLIYTTIYQQSMFAFLGFGHILLIQLSFLGWAAWLLIDWRRSTERNAGERESAKYVGVTLVVLLILYSAEMLRTLFPQSTYLRDVVPLTGSVAVLSLTFLALAESRVLIGLGAGRRKPIKQSSHLFDELEAKVKGEKLYLDARLSLDDLAGVANLSARTISVLINECGGKPFSDFINSFRLKHAKAMLVDPNEARTSIEAIGLLSGFGSRSSFYSAFGKAQGLTPAEFRTKQLNESKMS